MIRNKVSLKKSLRAGLVLKGLLAKDIEELTPSPSKKPSSASPLPSPAQPGDSSLTYQQQRELLRLQLECKQVDSDLEMAKFECEIKVTLCNNCTLK